MNSFPDIVIEVIARFTEGFCLYFLFMAFGRQKFKATAHKCIATVFAWTVLSKIISLAVYPDGVQVPEKELISIFLRAMLMCIIGIFFYRINKNVVLFIVLTFTSFIYISWHMNYVVALLLINGFDRMAMRIDALNNMELVSTFVTCITFIRSIFAIILIIISAKIIIKNYKHDLNSKDPKEIISYMLPVIMGSFSAVVLHFIISFVNDRGRIEYKNYMDDTYIYFAVTVIFAAIWVAMLMSFKIQQEMIGFQEEQVQKSIYENQISQMQSSMTEMEAFYDGIRRVRHDMKNQMEALKNMMEIQTCVENDVSGYFDDMQNTLDRLDMKIHTGNAVSDAVINAKFKLAEKEIPGIKLDADDFFLPDSITIKPYDIGIILNNGLDNAIEACREMRTNSTKDGSVDSRRGQDCQRGQGSQREQECLCGQHCQIYITLKSYKKRSMFFIEIENSFCGNILIREDDLPLTSKQDNRLHGIGLKNIRACAQKYMGDIECIAIDGVFVLSVMLKS